MIFNPFIIETFYYIESTDLVLNYTRINLVSSLSFWDDFILLFFIYSEKLEIFSDLLLCDNVVPDLSFKYYNYFMNMEKYSLSDFFYLNFFDIINYRLHITVERNR